MLKQFQRIFKTSKNNLKYTTTATQLLSPLTTYSTTEIYIIYLMFSIVMDMIDETCSSKYHKILFKHYHTFNVKKLSYLYNFTGKY